MPLGKEYPAVTSVNVLSCSNSATD